MTGNGDTGSPTGTADGQPGPMLFDDGTLEEIAAMACGDEPGMKYRRGWELPQFLRRAGWDNVPEHDGPRLRWVLDLLRERNQDQDGDIEAVILRLADRREYLQAPEEHGPVLARLEEVLALEGLYIAYQGTSPALTTRHPKPQRVELKVSVTDIVSDPQLAATIQLRLDEAHICQEHGAYTAAGIMLGSLLEGVLIHAAQSRTPTVAPPSGLLRNPRLHDLIKHAHDNHWIDQDAMMASDLVRTYRNLVHPLAEQRARHSVDFDTADLCWSTVNAVLNDLAATNTAGPGR